MDNSIHVIERDVAFDPDTNIRYCAQIHADKIRVFSPFIVRYTGMPYQPFARVLAATDNTITSQELVDAVLADMARDKEADAWAKIARSLNIK